MVIVSYSGSGLVGWSDGCVGTLTVSGSLGMSAAFLSATFSVATGNGNVSVATVGISVWYPFNRVTL